MELGEPPGRLADGYRIFFGAGELQLSSCPQLDPLLAGASLPDQPQSSYGMTVTRLTL